MKRLLSAVGFLLFAVLIGMGGGIGAQLTMAAQAKPECGYDLICHLARVLSVPGGGTGGVSANSCFQPKDVAAMVKLVALLKATPDATVSENPAVKEQVADKCPSFQALAFAACVSVNGGNSGDINKPQPEVTCKGLSEAKP